MLSVHAVEYDDILTITRVLPLPPAWSEQAFLGVVKETVDLVALEAASKALQEAIEEEQQASSRCAILV